MHKMAIHAFSPIRADMTLLQIREDLINFCQDFHVTTTKLIDVKKVSEISDLAPLV